MIAPWSLQPVLQKNAVPQLYKHKEQLDDLSYNIKNDFHKNIFFKL